MKKAFKEDFGSIIFMLLVVAAIPLAAWAVWPKPLHADSATQLAALAREARQDKIVAAMHARYEGGSWSAENEASDPSHNPVLQWEEMRTSIQQQDTSFEAAEEVVKLAQKELPTQWPITAEKAWIKDEEVWMIIGSTPTETGAVAWICPPSLEDIRSVRIERYCTNVRVAAITVSKPHRLVR